MAEAMTLCLLQPWEGAFRGNLWTDILNASSGPCRNSPPKAMEKWGFLLVPKSCQWKVICAQTSVKYGNRFTFSSIHWEQTVPAGKCTDQVKDATLPAPHP